MSLLIPPPSWFVYNLYRWIADPYSLQNEFTKIHPGYHSRNCKLVNPVVLLFPLKTMSGFRRSNEQLNPPSDKWLSSQSRIIPEIWWQNKQWNEGIDSWNAWSVGHFFCFMAFDLLISFVFLFLWKLSLLCLIVDVPVLVLCYYMSCL